MATTFDDLTALYINCSLKRTGDESHTMRLLDRSAAIMRSENVAVDVVHALDHHIAFGMTKDAGDHGPAADEWPALHERVMAADILVIGSPIWLGAVSSVARLVIERLYAYSGDTNDKDQYLYYGKVGGCVLTGNEDGIKACAEKLLYALQHIGYTIPPQADCGWVGEAGPGPSYGDEVDGRDDPVGFDNEFTNRNTTFMTWNLMHMARLLRDSGGFPAQGNTSAGWKDVTNAAHENPEYR